MKNSKIKYKTWPTSSENINKRHQRSKIEMANFLSLDTCYSPVSCHEIFSRLMEWAPQGSRIDRRQTMVDGKEKKEKKRRKERKKERK